MTFLPKAATQLSGPDIFRLKRRLLANELTFVPCITFLDNFQDSLFVDRSLVVQRSLNGRFALACHMRCFGQLRSSGDSKNFELERQVINHEPAIVVSAFEGFSSVAGFYNHSANCMTLLRRVI